MKFYYHQKWLFYNDIHSTTTIIIEILAYYYYYQKKNNYYYQSSLLAIVDGRRVYCPVAEMLASGMEASTAVLDPNSQRRTATIL